MLKMHYGSENFSMSHKDRKLKYHLDSHLQVIGRKILKISQVILEELFILAFR